MKIILLSIVTILFSPFTSLSQTYKPMPIDSAFWGLKYVTQFNTSYNKEIVKGDTLLGGKNYHKTYSNTGTLLGFYRELNKKVYGKVSSHPDTSEILIYDFNLNIGDTFYDKRTTPSQVTFYYKYKVTSITTSTATTDSRKQYYFSCVGYQGPATSYSNVGAACALPWIEGIGSVQGLFNTRANGEGLECFLAALSTGATAYLVCFEHKNIQYMAQSCLTVGSQVNTSTSSFGQLFINPNPAVDYVELSINDPELRNSLTVLYIHNNLGQLVKEVKIIFESNSFRTNISDLNNGVYFVSIKNIKSETLIKKLVINN